MTQKQAKHYQQTLKEKLVDLLSERRRLEQVRVDRSPDNVDEAQDIAVVEVAIKAMDTESEFVAQVTDALERFEIEEYGLCEDCGEAISPLRLDALPWAVRCIGCQQMVESEPPILAEAA